MSSASGNTIYSAGFMLGVNTKMQQEKKLETGDTVDKFYEDMMKVSQGRGDPKLTRLVAEKADETLNWLHDYVGVKYAVGMKLWFGRCSSMCSPHHRRKEARRYTADALFTG